MRVIKDFLVAVVLAIVMVILAFIFYKPKPQIQVLDREVIKRDTIVVVDYREPEPIYIEKKVFVTDTVYVTAENDSIETEVAQLDTTFRDGEQLSVTYYSVPHVFGIEFVGAKDSIKTVTITKEITTYVDSSAFWDKFKWGATSGVIATALLTFLVK